MSLSDIKKATAAFKPSLNKTFHVDEAFVVPSKKAVVDEALLMEMPQAELHPEGEKPTKALFGDASDVERNIVGGHPNRSHGIGLYRHIKKALAGDPAFVHGEPTYTPAHDAVKKANKSATGLQAAYELAQKDHDANATDLARPKATALRAKYAATHARSGKYLEAIKASIPKILELRKTVKAPEAVAAKAAPTLDPKAVDIGNV